MCGDNEQIPRGAETIGSLSEADDLVRLYVWMLRRWLDGVCGQQAIWNRVAAATGPADGHAVMGLFEAQMSAVTKHARRKLYRHGSDCTCIGADEGALAAIVDEARDGPTTEAYQAAGRIVRGAGLYETVETTTHLARTLAPIAHAVMAEVKAASPTSEETPPVAPQVYRGRLH